MSKESERIRSADIDQHKVDILTYIGSLKNLVIPISNTDGFFRTEFNQINSTLDLIKAHTDYIYKR